MKDKNIDKLTENKWFLKNNCWDTISGSTSQVRLVAVKNSWKECQEGLFCFLSSCSFSVNRSHWHSQPEDTGPSGPFAWLCALLQCSFVHQGIFRMIPWQNHICFRADLFLPVASGRTESKLAGRSCFSPCFPADRHQGCCLVTRVNWLSLH